MCVCTKVYLSVLPREKEDSGEAKILIIFFMPLEISCKRPRCGKKAEIVGHVLVTFFSKKKRCFKRIFLKDTKIF